MTDDPPYCEQTELAVLSVLLDGRHAEAWYACQSILRSPEYFFVKKHQMLYICCEAIARQRKKIDTLSIQRYADSISFIEAIDTLRGKQPRSDQDRQQGTLLAWLGGRTWLGDVAGSPGSIGAFVDNCEALQVLWRKRQIERVLLASSGKDNADEIIAKLAGLSKPQLEPSTSAEAMQSVMERHDRLADGKETVRIGSYGLPTLDRVLPLASEQLITIGAAPGCGKSSLALMAATYTSEKLGKNSVAFVSLEMSPTEIVAINLGREAGVDRKKITDGKLIKSDRNSVVMAQEKLSKCSFYIKGNESGSTLDNICAWIQQRHIESRGALHLVCIDYLQLIESSDPKKGEREKLVDATRRLKRLAGELKVCVLSLSGMNAEGTKRERDKNGGLKAAPEPRLEDLHGSSSMGKDSNGVLLLWSTAVHTTSPTIPVMLKIAKNRSGATVTFEAEFRRAEGQKLVEVSAHSCERGNREVSINRMEQEPTNDEDVLA